MERSPNGEIFENQGGEGGSCAISCDQVAPRGSYFTLKASNGEVVGVSEMYTTRASAQSGIESVQRTLADLDLI